MKYIEIEDSNASKAVANFGCKSLKFARKYKRIQLKIKKYKIITEKIDANCDSLKELSENKEYNDARHKLTMARHELAELYMNIKNYM